MTIDHYLDRLISEKLVAIQENREPSGKLSASKLYWPLQWQILAARFKMKLEVDEYTLRKFQRGKDVENWFVKQIEPVESQKFLEYRGVIGFCDSIVDTSKWDTTLGEIPLEVKSVTNMKFKRLEASGADAGHILQNAFYALALGKEHHAITYIASDDYRILTSIHKTSDSKDEIEKIITEFEEAMKLETIPLFVPRAKWQETLKYNSFPLFAGLNADELKVQYQKLIQNNG